MSLVLIFFGFILNENLAKISIFFVAKKCKYGSFTHFYSQSEVLVLLGFRGYLSLCMFNFKTI